jgi:uncharacterized hydrophobic protein (TIGR00271 family)
MADPKTKASWGQIFDLRQDQAEAAVIDAELRGGVPFRGTNLWLLILAIFVASIGLNVNATAVIIGAMLISPLMGPIMGLGYAAAINDFALLRSALRNLGVAVSLSLATSTLYFLLTPLDGGRSELLARTTPSLWDVLIALVGGLAGIIGMSRRVKSNVVPGVAIATALMPPLCTAGYGLASGEAAWFLGAFYLFFINSVFIGTATLVMCRVMGLPEVEAVDARTRARSRRAVWAVVVFTAVPSIGMAVRLVQAEVYNARVAAFVASAFPPAAGRVVVRTDADAAGRALGLTVLGPPLDAGAEAGLQDQLAAAGLPGVRLTVARAGDDRLDVGALKAALTDDLSQRTLAALEEKSTRIASLESELAALRADGARLDAVAAEVRAAFPEAGALAVRRGRSWAPGAVSGDDGVLVELELPHGLLDAAEAERWSRSLAARLGVPSVELRVRPPSLAGTPPRGPQ